MPRLLQKIEDSSLAMINQNSSSSPIPLNLQIPQPSPLPPPPEVSLSVSEPTDSINLQEKNCTSPSISSSDSMNISKFPEFSEYPTTSSLLLHDFGNIVYNPYVDNSSYDMDDFNTSVMSLQGGYEASDCHMAESNWVGNDVAESIWSIDELWQFRKLQDRGI
nr:TPA_asm: hypothetical protein HUJ06_010671 [Nelumbo nucifera]